MTASREFAVDCEGNSSHLGIPGLYKLFRFAVVTERKGETTYSGFTKACSHELIDQVALRKEIANSHTTLNLQFHLLLTARNTLLCKYSMQRKLPQLKLEIYIAISTPLINITLHQFLRSTESWWKKVLGKLEWPESLLSFQEKQLDWQWCQIELHP